MTAVANLLLWPGFWSKKSQWTPLTKLNYALQHLELKAILF